MNLLIEVVLEEKESYAVRMALGEGVDVGALGDELGHDLKGDLNLGVGQTFEGKQSVC